MTRILFCLIALAVSATTAVAQQADPFDAMDRFFAEAEKGFAELDSATAQLQRERRSEFRSMVTGEMSLLELDLVQSGMDSSRVVAIMAIAQKVVSPLLTDDTSDPQVLDVQFRRFITGYRVQLGLVDTTVTTTASVIPDSATAPASPGTVTFLVTPGRSVGLDDILAARQNANWSENLDRVPDNWPKRNGHTWTSEDGLVTFAVGRGQSRIIQLARDKAQLDAAMVLARRGQTTSTAVAPASGDTAVRYTPSDKDGVVLCLVAIPTSLLE